MTRILIALIGLCALPAFADIGPRSFRLLSDGTAIGTICSAQTATATGCTVASAPDSDLRSGTTTKAPVIDARGFSSVAFYTTASTSTDYTCDIYSSDTGYDGDTGVGQDRSSTSLTETQELIVLDGALGYVWAECSEIANNSVTLSFVATK